VTDVSGPGISGPQPARSDLARLGDGALVLELTAAAGDDAPRRRAGQRPRLRHRRGGGDPPGSGRRACGRSPRTCRCGCARCPPPTALTRRATDPAPGPALGHVAGRAEKRRGGADRHRCHRLRDGPSQARTDPPKPNVPLGQIPVIFRDPITLARPLREEAGIEVIDAAAGVVQVEVTPALRNPAGTLQGAMVALLAEAAAEDLLTTRFESPVVVTNLDLRYLRKAEVGPVRTRSRLLGTNPDAAVQVELIDTSTDQITTLVYASAVTSP
jgi:acyl-coenzyme A thioesterase PaaI-like protein